MNTTLDRELLVAKVCDYANSNYDWKTLRSLLESLTPEERISATHMGTNESNHIIRRTLAYIGSVEEKLCPKYGTISDAIHRFNTKGQRQKARAELRVRMPFVSYDEHQLIVETFIGGAKEDRIWLCKHLYKNWDEKQLPAIILMYEQYHYYETACLVVKYAPLDYIMEHEDELAKATSYLQVYLRYPNLESINNRNLISSDYFYFCAKKNISISEMSLKRDLSLCAGSTIINAYYKAYGGAYHIPYHGILWIPEMRRFIWCLSRFGRTDLILKLIEFDRETLRHIDDETPNVIDNMVDSFCCLFDFYAK